VGLAVGGVGCSGPETPSTDSKSNWLEACSTHEDCASELSCLCGVCSIACTQDDECEQDRPARCLAPETYAQCPTPANGETSCVSTCEVPADCLPGQICLRNVCVADGAPPADACEATLDWDDSATAFEVAMVDAINRQRANGTECDNTSFVMDTPLVLDFRLRCAARVHAADMVSQGYFDEIAPDGTTAGDRITSAGYPFSTWGIVIAQGTDQAAVDAVFTAYCALFSDPTFQDIGVGASVDTWSIYLAAQQP
jgi:uncharacterized protein YkwD